MAHRWLAIGAVAVAVVAGCGSPPSASRSIRSAEQTAQWTRAHGDGYRRADDPDAIADLLEKYAKENDGEVLAREVEHGSRPGGHVDVRFHLEADKWEAETWECWRFGFRKPDDDAYVREIEFDRIRCPTNPSPGR